MNFQVTVRATTEVGHASAPQGSLDLCVASPVRQEPTDGDAWAGARVVTAENVTTCRARVGVREDGQVQTVVDPVLLGGLVPAVFTTVTVTMAPPATLSTVSANVNLDILGTGNLEITF